MTMKKICTLPIIAALLLCGCSKGMTVIPAADTAVSVTEVNAPTQTDKPAETTHSAVTSAAASETEPDDDIPIDDDTDIFEDNEFTDNSADIIPDISDIADEELSDNTISVTASSVSASDITGTLGQDTFFGKAGDKVFIGLPDEHPEIMSGCLLTVTLSDNYEVMESYPPQISSEYVEHIDIISYPDE